MPDIHVSVNLSMPEWFIYLPLLILGGLFYSFVGGIVFYQVEKALRTQEKHRIWDERRCPLLVAMVWPLFLAGLYLHHTAFQSLKLPIALFCFPGKKVYRKLREREERITERVANGCTGYPGIIHQQNNKSSLTAGG